MKQNVTVAELAWLAGIIDGEGSIFIMRNTRKDRERSFNYILRVSVQSTDTIMARACAEITEIGATYTSVTKQEANSNTHKWQVEGKKATRVLKELLPYLRVKLDQAESAIEFQETTKKHWRRMEASDYQKQEEFYYKLKQLKIDSKMGKDTIAYENANKVIKLVSDKRIEGVENGVRQTVNSNK